MSLPRLFYDNRLADATPIATSTAAGDFDPLYLIDWRPYTWWQPASMPATVEINAGSANADFFLVYGHDMGTQGSTIELRGSTDGFIASDDLVATATPTDDLPFIIEYATVTYSDWRVVVSGATAPSLAIVAAGEVLTMPAPLLPGFDPFGRRPVITNNRSKGGHPLGKVLEYEDYTVALRFEWLTWAWLRATWDPAWRAHLRSIPFVFAWDLENYPTELRLVTVDGQFATPHQPGLYAHLEFSVSGVYE